MAGIPTIRVDVRGFPSQGYDMYASFLGTHVGDDDDDGDLQRKSIELMMMIKSCQPCPKLSSFQRLSISVSSYSSESL